MKGIKVIKINRLSIKVLALSCGIWSAAQLGFVPSGFSADPSVIGQWEQPVLDWSSNFRNTDGHNVAVHLVALPTGKVIMYPFAGRYHDVNEANPPRLWDPANNSLTLLPLPPGYPAGWHNIFCGAHSLVPDGRVLFTGGDVIPNSVTDRGESQATYFN